MGDHQDLHQTISDLLEIKGKFINNNPSSRNLLWNLEGEKENSNSAIMKLRRSRKPAIRNNTLKMIKRQRARRVGREGSRRALKIERKVRTLKKLIPNGDSSVGLDGLFRETADYISSLQMRVKIMQAVVNALSNSE